MIDEEWTDKERLDWAEKNPEKVMKVLQSWWATAGPGFREEWFNFRGVIDEAKNDI